ncbi:hypothetical protein ABZP36_029116 [Zizania latifolia]
MQAFEAEYVNMSFFVVNATVAAVYIYDTILVYYLSCAKGKTRRKPNHDLSLKAQGHTHVRRIPSRRESRAHVNPPRPVPSIIPAPGPAATASALWRGRPRRPLRPDEAAPRRARRHATAGQAKRGRYQTRFRRLLSLPRGAVASRGWGVALARRAAVSRAVHVDKASAYNQVRRGSTFIVALVIFRKRLPTNCGRVGDFASRAHTASHTIRGTRYLAGVWYMCVGRGRSTGQRGTCVDNAGNRD